jgi:hypothetical protein
MRLMRLTSRKDLTGRKARLWRDYGGVRSGKAYSPEMRGTVKAGGPPSALPEGLSLQGRLQAQAPGMDIIPPFSSET